MQEKQHEWAWQWEQFRDDSDWLFRQWMEPYTLEDFRGKTILDCGCGGGQHVSFVAPIAKEVWGVDLNAINSAIERTKHFSNVRILEADIATMDLKHQFDIVYSIGVLHHTDDPRRSFRNIARHARPGGRVIVWVYSHEGNFLNRTLIEWSKRVLVSSLPRTVVRWISHLLTIILYIPIYTVYLLPLTFLPYYEYFQNWRRLSYRRNLLNVFDKLNAPQTHFIKRSQLEQWFTPEEFADIVITPWLGVSWRASGVKK